MTASVWPVLGRVRPGWLCRGQAVAQRAGAAFRSWRQGRFLRRTVRHALSLKPGLRIVLLAAPDAALVTVLGNDVGRRVHVVDPDVRESQLFGRLAGLGPVDLLIDGDRVSGHEIDRFRALFLLVVNGGTYVAPGFTPQSLDRLSGLVGELASGRDRSLPKSEREALAAAIAGIERKRGQLSVTRRGRTLPKLRETEMNEALAADPSRGRIIASVPAMGFDSRCVLRSNGRARKDRTQDHYNAPALYLREYFDVSCRPKSVVIQRGLLCPDTYRHHLGPRLSHKSLKDAGRRFVVTPRNEPPTHRLEERTSTWTTRSAASSVMRSPNRFLVCGRGSRRNRCIPTSGPWCLSTVDERSPSGN